MKNSQKLVSISLYLILAISVIILGVFYYNTSGLQATLKENGWAAIAEEMGSSLNLFLGWAYVLIGIAAAAAIIPSIVQLFTRPQNAVKSAISIVVLAVFVLIAYALSDGTPFTPKQLPAYDGSDNVPSMLKFGDTMIFTTYFLLAGAVLSIIYAEVSKIFK